MVVVGLVSFSFLIRQILSVLSRTWKKPMVRYVVEASAARRTDYLCKVDSVAALTQTSATTPAHLLTLSSFLAFHTHTLLKQFSSVRF